MGISLEVERSRIYKDGTYVPGNTIKLVERNFCIDVDRTTLYTMGPDEARYIATELWKLAEQIDGKTKKDSILKKIRTNIEKIAKEAKKEAMK